MDERSPDIADAPVWFCSARPAWAWRCAAAASPAAMDQAIRALVGEATVKRGKVKLELPPIVENGNAVPLTVSVDSPMSEADHVTAHPHLQREEPAALRRGFRARAARRQGGGIDAHSPRRLATGRGDRPAQRRQLLVRQRRCHRDLGGLRRRVRGRWRGS